MKYLLIGNGPSAVSRPMQHAIDNFDGIVVRFNNYHIKGWETHVGTRTDVWVTIDWFPEAAADTHKERWWVNLAKSPEHDKIVAALKATRLPQKWLDARRGAQCATSPSSGLGIAAYLLSEGHSVTLWGFDFMSPLRGHHYGDKVPRGQNHTWFEEWKWFAPRLYEGTIDYLGWDRKTQGAPLVRLPTPCGTDKNISAGREPSQMGWYEWAARRCFGKKVLDVGAGTCAGLRLLSTVTSEAHGLDVDPRLAGTHPNLHIIPDLSQVASKSYDVVLAMDVLEHVTEDLVLMENLKRIAKEQVIVSTPNGHRSQCQNHAHCREYTIPQFCNVFSPDEVWSGSPDGSVHITFLLGKTKDSYLYYGAQGPDNLMKDAHLPELPLATMPISTRFNQTVDFEEWPHITAVFNV